MFSLPVHEEKQCNLFILQVPIFQNFFVFLSNLTNRSSTNLLPCCVYITKFPQKRSGQNRLVFVVFRVYSYDIRLKLVRKHSPAVFIQIQDGVREGPRKRANFPANLAQISAISRGRKSFFGSFILVYCVSMKFFPINLNG